MPPRNGAHAKYLLDQSRLIAIAHLLDPPKDPLAQTIFICVSFGSDEVLKLALNHLAMFAKQLANVIEFTGFDRIMNRLVDHQ